MLLSSDVGFRLMLLYPFLPIHGTVMGFFTPTATNCLNYFNVLPPEKLPFSLK
jgi:hypothetical protein